MNRTSRCILAALAAACALQAAPAAAQGKSNQTEITQGNEQFMRTLASMPYTSSGSGPVVYVLEFSECPYCQAFEREWKGKLKGVEMRRFFYGVSPRTANETAYLARTRNIDDFHAFMNRTKVAPDFKASPAGIDAFNAIIAPLGKVLMPILHKNGWPNRNPVSPMFMWEANGRVYVRGGYTNEAMKEILGMVRGGSKRGDAAGSIVLTASPGTASAPASAGAPDFLGARVGVSGIDETREALRAFTPRLTLTESRAQFPNVPDTQHIVQIRGTAQSSGSIDSWRQVVTAVFSQPPDAGKLVMISKTSVYTEEEASTLEATLGALQKKYGAPGWQKEAKYDKAREIFLAWAWSREGKPLPLGERHACAQRGANGGSFFGIAKNRAYDDASSMLNAGCAAIVHMIVRVQHKDLVTGLDGVAFDAVRAQGTIDASRKFIQDARSKATQETRDKAAKREAPKL